MTAQISTGRLDDARNSYRQSVEIAAKLIERGLCADPYPAAHEGGTLIARNASTQIEWASALVGTGQFSEAEELCRSAIGTSEREMREYPQVPIHRENLENAHRELAVTLSHQQRQEEAEAEVRKATDLLPQTAASYNLFAWKLATDTDRAARFPTLAVEFAQKAVEMEPTNGSYWNALGVAQYRASQWEKAIDSLQKSMAIKSGGDAFDFFFLAMVQQKSGQPDEARKWYDKGLESMEKNAPQNLDLIRFRAESAATLGVPLLKEADSAKPSEPATPAANFSG